MADYHTCPFLNLDICVLVEWFQSRDNALDGDLHFWQAIVIPSVGEVCSPASKDLGGTLEINCHSAR